LVWPPPPSQARIRYLGSISEPKDIGRKKGFWRKLWEFVRGDEEDERIERSMAMAVDGRDRLLETDTKKGRVHIFDRHGGGYAYLKGTKWESLKLPIGLAVDAGDNIYVADGEANKIFVFTADGKFDRILDSAEWLKRPAALAIDRQRQYLYVVDTPAHDIKVVDLTTGGLHSVIGHRGEAKGEFNYPTYVALDRQGRLAITDSMNKRIQIFDHEGHLISVFGKAGDGSGDFSVPKGVAMDSDGHVYVADAGFDNIQIFDQSGRLLLFWGTSGQEAGEFWLPTGLLIDAQDRIYVADSYNNRVQIFQYLGGQAGK
jgi:DNA-binding beta-propeller fold protein YncE